MNITSQAMPQLVVCMSANVKRVQSERDGSQREIKGWEDTEGDSKNKDGSGKRRKLVSGEERKTKIIGRKDETSMAEDRGKYQSTRSGGEGWGGLCTRTHITQTEQRRTSWGGVRGENVDSGWWRQ